MLKVCRATVLVLGLACIVGAGVYAWYDDYSRATYYLLLAIWNLEFNFKA